MADEVFLTGTAVEVIAVIDVDGRKITDGKPGEITKQLLDEFRTNRHNRRCGLLPATIKPCYCQLGGLKNEKRYD